MRKKLSLLLLSLILIVTAIPTVSFGSENGTLKAPNTVSAVESGKNDIKLSWSEVKNAAKYEIWQSSGKKYSKVKTVKSKSYVVKSLSKSKAYKFKIRAISKNGKKSSYSYYVAAVTKQSDKNNVKKITLNKKTAVINVGETINFKAKVTPSKKLVKNKVVWKSSNKNIAEIKDGTVTAKAPGEVTITARAINGKKAIAKVVVLADSVAAKDIYKMTKYVDSSEDYGYSVAKTLAYDMEFADDSTGFRTAGSDAEHKTADYLANEFKNIGLTDVEKVDVSIDKWQFNDATIKVKSEGKSFDITNKNGEVISYASPGTKQLGGDWENLEVVDLGKGTKAEYDNYYKATGEKDMTGKVVLVALDQWNTYWVSLPYMEAANQKAAAIITYQYGGYASLNDDAINVQDLCAPKNNLPLLSISRNSAKKITDAIKADAKTTIDLFVDNEVYDGEGTSYNVVGKIPGKSHEQQIILAAHYDKYFYGFQDDCIAIGMIMAMAKTMIDSGYVPENDIVVVAHAAEEWAQFDTEYDWACGSWQMIKNKHPEWQGKTLAVINYELPAIDIGKPQGVFKSSVEFGKLAEKYVESDVLSMIEPFYTNGWKIQNDDQGTLTDCISYATNGVPFIMPRQDDRSEWTKDRYHTQYDDEGTYSEELFKYSLMFYTGIAAYIDKNPAVVYDFTSRSNYMLNGVNEETVALVGAENVETYKASAEQMKVKAAEFEEKGEKINSKYAEAVKNGASEDELKAIRSEGAEYNKKALKIFAKIQDDMIGLYGSGETAIHHQGYQYEVKRFDNLINALSDGTVTEEDVLLGKKINGGADKYYWLFSDNIVSDFIMNVSSSKRSNDNWGANETTASFDTRDAAMNLIKLFDSGKTNTGEYSNIINKYKKVRTEAYNGLKTYLLTETKAMNEIAEMMR